MSDFVITVNSTVDVPKEWLEERNVPVVPLKYTIDGETYEDMNGLSAQGVFPEAQGGKDGSDFPGKSGGGQSCSGAFPEGGQRRAPSGIFFRTVRHLQQHDDRRRGTEGGLPGPEGDRDRHPVRLPGRGPAPLLRSEAEGRRKDHRGSSPVGGGE